METACICRERAEPLRQEDLQYVEWRDGTDNLKAFKQHGYIVVRELLSRGEVEETISEISRICRDWLEKLKTSGEDGNDWEEIANRYRVGQTTCAYVSLLTDCQSVKDKNQIRTQSSPFVGCSAWPYIMSTLVPSVVILALLP